MKAGGPSAASRQIPEGVVTFLFTDIEGSTRLLRRLGDAYADVLATHHRVIRGCVAAHAGYEVLTEGDAFFLAFSDPCAAVAASVSAQRSLSATDWPPGEPVKVRMGLHTGEPTVVDNDYVGVDVHRAARIAAAAHGGQIVVSARLRDLVDGCLPDGVKVRDLGEHWLKDFPMPEHVLQLDVLGLPDTFPPLDSLAPPTNVPHSAAALVGRQAERREVLQLVSHDARLVTLTGPGGAGKTRLAAAVALELLAKTPQGVWFVDLSLVTEAEGVMPAIARVLQAPLEGEEAAEEAVARHLGDRATLLVLDNLEQVVDAAPAVGRLLWRCPRLRVLATSRILLGLRDELEYAVPGMTLPAGPSLADVTRSEAAQLFVERARRARSNFILTETNAPAVARICALLDGLPLALELAAARTRLFQPQALVERLGDRLGLLTGGAKDAPRRHRTLRATIDWSYSLLSEDERQFFGDMAVFEGGARLDVIEAVVVTDGDVLDLVTTLVDHSLVVRREDPDNEPRFTMLQTIREYAVRRLHEDPAHHRETCRRHAEHMLRLMSAGWDEGRAADEGVVEREHDNVVAALGYWLQDRGRDHTEDAHKGLLLAVSLGDYWYHHGLVNEGAGWLERALAVASDPAQEVEAKARRLLGVMHEQRQDLARAHDEMSQALRLYRELGDQDGEAKCLNSLGVIARSAGAADEAERYVLDAVALRRRSGQSDELSAALNNLGILYLDRGEWREAVEVLTETLGLDRSAGNEWGIAVSSLNLSVAHVLAGAAADARRLLRDAVRLFRRVGDPDGTIESLEACVGLATSCGRWPAAARVAAAAARAREERGLPGSPADRRHLDGWLGETRASLGDTGYDATWAEGSAMTLDQGASYALREVLDAGAGS